MNPWRVIYGFRLIINRVIIIIITTIGRKKRQLEMKCPGQKVIEGEEEEVVTCYMLYIFVIL